VSLLHVRAGSQTKELAPERYDSAEIAISIHILIHLILEQLIAKDWICSH
jgi:hypothetical protein